jgi:hypothetical protein
MSEPRDDTAVFGTCPPSVQEHGQDHPEQVRDAAGWSDRAGGFTGGPEPLAFDGASHSTAGARRPDLEHTAAVLGTARSHSGARG